MSKQDIYLIVITLVAILALAYLLANPGPAGLEALREFV